MKTKITENIPTIDPYKTVTLKETGNVRSITSPKFRNEKATVIPLSKNEYVHCESGEIKQYKNHSRDRTGNMDSLRKSLVKLRDIINTNLTAETIPRTRFVTLTYKENMTDAKRLYEDADTFNKRFRYYLKKNHGGISYEYISTVEAQGRGAFHLHIIMIFTKPPPFIENPVLARIWGHGFVNIQKLSGIIDNIGAYLTAYLADLDITEENFSPDLLNKKAVIKNGKAVIKGERLKLLPAEINLYRTSRGIKRPEIISTTYGEALERLSSDGYSLEKRSAVKFENPENGFSNTIIYETYKQHFNLSFIKKDR